MRRVRLGAYKFYVRETLRSTLHYKIINIY